jgi:hypothetical protein
LGERRMGFSEKKIPREVEKEHVKALFCIVAAARRAKGGRAK